MLLAPEDDSDMGLSTPFSGAPTNTITSLIAESVYVPPEPYISADRPAHSSNRHEDQSASTAASSPHGNERRIFHFVWPFV